MRLIPLTSRVVPALLILGLASCATSGAPRPVGSSSTVISADELAGASQSNLLEVVQALRPHWLRTQTTTLRGEQPDVIVYLDMQRLGNREALRQFHPRAAAQLRYYSPSEAQLRFGLGHLNGAIQVFARTGREPQNPAP